VYGATKWAGEQAIVRSGVPHLIIRTSWVYGARGQNFLRTMLRFARERDELTVVADQVGAPTASWWIAATTLEMLEHLAADRHSSENGNSGIFLGDAMGGTFHVTASGSTSWYGFASALLQADPRRGEQRVARITPISSQAFGAKAPRPANSRLSTDRLTKTFGIVPLSWEAQLERVMAELPVP
jgi:dTDP-4-dehydrorhamnose reductase